MSENQGSAAYWTAFAKGVEAIFTTSNDKHLDEGLTLDKLIEMKKEFHIPKNNGLCPRLSEAPRFDPPEMSLSGLLDFGVPILGLRVTPIQTEAYGGARHVDVHKDKKITIYDDGQRVVEKRFL